MAQCFGLNDISKISNHNFFFDANVLIYLFGNSSNSVWEEQYAKLYKSLINSQNLFVNFMIISEFINREAKISYHSHLSFYNISKNQLTFKDYRNCPDGIEVLNGIYETVKVDILEKFNIIDESFSKNDIVDFLKIDSLDFNDKAIKNICLKNNYILVTNDSDFINTDLNILTANNIILKASS